MNDKQTIKCISKAFIERGIIPGGFRWAVYNEITGQIVATLSSEGMARHLVTSMNTPNSGYIDGYDYCEIWRE